MARREFESTWIYFLFRLPFAFWDMCVSEILSLGSIYHLSVMIDIFQHSFHGPFDCLVTK